MNMILDNYTLIISKFIGISDTHDYHLNWENLIKVVEKIERVSSTKYGRFIVTISNSECTIHSTSFKPFEKEYTGFNIEYTGKSKYEAVMRAVSGFINWYNLNVTN